MSLTVLSVAFALTPVTPDVAGGAEQVLATLDRALVRAGHRSLVVAQPGSRVAGELVRVEPVSAPFDADAVARAQGHQRAAVARALASGGVDLVHMHGIDFASCLPDPGPPVLVTLHLPPSWYGPDALDPARPDTWLHCVSAEQHAACPPSPRLLPPIENGIDVESFLAPVRRRGFALFLGRICPEKGVHVAIEAAARAGCPLLIAGPVSPFETHLRYFDEEIRPHLGPACRLVGGVGFRAKRRLLSAARCLLAPALCAETSSLVAREAAACGTPVIAFPNGALSAAVEPGRTGFLVDDAAAMAAAIGRARDIDPETCRAVARTRFAEEPMISAYLDLYGRLAALSAGAAEAVRAA